MYTRKEERRRFAYIDEYVDAAVQVVGVYEM